MASRATVVVLSVLYAVGLLSGWLVARVAAPWEAPAPKASTEPPPLTLCVAYPEVYLAAFEALHASTDVPYLAPSDMAAMHNTTRFVNGPLLLRTVLSIARRTHSVGGLVTALAPACARLVYTYARIDCSASSALHVLSVGPTATIGSGLGCSEPCEGCDQATRVRRAFRDRDVRCSVTETGLPSAGDWRGETALVRNERAGGGVSCVTHDDRGNVWIVIPK
jgi:hypothetical protein